MPPRFRETDSGVLLPTSTAEQLGSGSPTGDHRTTDFYGYGGATATKAYNPATGQGDPDRDPTTRTFLLRTLFLQRRTLQAAYAESDMTRKLISVLPEDALARGILFPDLDTEQEMMWRDRMEELRLVEQLRFSGMWANLFGDSYVYLDDGTAEDIPFDIDTYQMGSLMSLPIFSGYEVIPDPDSMVNDFGDREFGMPEVYMLREGYDEYRPVDPTRLLRTRYLPPPPGGWETAEASGIPNKTRSCCSLGMMNALLPLVTGELEAIGAVRRLTYEASILEMGVEGFESLVQEDVNKATAAIEQLSNAKSVWGIFAHPKSNTVSRISVNFSGLDDILEKNLERIAIAADVPYSRFLGIEPSGLNASGEASTRRYAGKVAQFQREKFDPILDVVFPIIAKDLGWPEAPKWTWPHYITKSSKDEAEEKKVKVETLNALVDNLTYAVESNMTTEEKAQEIVDAFLMDLLTQES